MRRKGWQAELSAASWQEQRVRKEAAGQNKRECLACRRVEVGYTVAYPGRRIAMQLGMVGVELLEAEDMPLYSQIHMGLVRGMVLSQILRKRGP